MNSMVRPIYAYNGETTIAYLLSFGAYNDHQTNYQTSDRQPHNGELDNVTLIRIQHFVGGSKETKTRKYTVEECLIKNVGYEISQLNRKILFP